MKIYILDQFASSGVEFATQHVDVVRWGRPRAKNWHEDADGLVVPHRSRRKIFAKAKRLRVVAKQGVGVNLIDLVAPRLTASSSVTRPA